MNIAILVPTLGMGGAERAAASIGNYYHDKGHKVYYFLFANCGHLFFHAKGEIVKTHVFFPLLGKSYSESIREIMLTAKSYRKLKRKYKIDVAVSFMEACNFINVCSRGKEKVIVSVRTVLSERTECSGVLYDKRWIKILYSKADKIVSVSHYVKKDLFKNYGIPLGKIIAIPNVSVIHKSLQNESIPWKYGDKVVVCVGRLDPVKQHERLIRAFSFVCKNQSTARLILVGDGKQKEYLRSICKRMGLEKRVIFAGASTDVGYFLCHSRVFVMSSKVEGFPNVMVEAMAYGIPVVTTDSPGGCGEIVGKTKGSDEIQYCTYGILTPHIEGRIIQQIELEKEEKLLGEAMLRILEDDRLYEKYSYKALERARDFSEEKIMTLWDEALSI